MLKWMKVLVLLAGGLGVLAFFLPYFTFKLDDRNVDVSAYQFAGGPHEPIVDKLASMESPRCYYEGRSYCDYDELARGHSLVPLYFLSTITFLLTSVFAIWRKRMDVFGGLIVLAASLFAIGCFLHEFNSQTHHGVWHVTGPGALLLGLSGLLAIGPAIAIIYWREPDPIPLFKIRVPMARVVRR